MPVARDRRLIVSNNQLIYPDKDFAARYSVRNVNGTGWLRSVPIRSESRKMFGTVAPADWLTSKRHFYHLKMPNATPKVRESAKISSNHHDSSATAHEIEAGSARLALRLPSLKKEGPETALAHVIVDLREHEINCKYESYSEYPREAPIHICLRDHVPDRPIE